jgi:predicted Zn-dependent peptidase
MPVLTEELASIGDTISETELARVRAQLKAGLLMAMESTRSRAERLGQHMLIYGRPLPPEEIVAKIDAVDRDAISRTARRLFSGRTTLAALGPVGGVRSLEDAMVPGAAE